MPKGAIAATVDAPQDPGLLETRLRPAKLGQVRAAAGVADGVPAALRDRRDVRRRALAANPIFLMVLFILPPCMCASLTDAHTPSIVSEVSLYITWFLSPICVPVRGLVCRQRLGLSARRCRCPSSAGLGGFLIVVAVARVPGAELKSWHIPSLRRDASYGATAARRR